MADRDAPRAWMLPDESLPIRLMSTIWADAEGLHDDLREPSDVDAWLDAVGVDRHGARTGADELVSARALRDAVRFLAAQVTGDDRQAAIAPVPDVGVAVRCVNAAAARLPAPRLEINGEAVREGVAIDGSAVTAGLARVAGESIALLGSSGAARLRACYAPGCVLYFVKAHPRREWCSVACGNRVRAARHYEKTREAARARQA
ncbi:CGNR zinc finger domain-containing protein [Promicromonospora iranensis]|uniref:CGNR zinc finger domain-containing protein n=1 Tax=Promicromonospora iranensis TaxID=1105144 RepID=UPI0023A99CC7|nr:ABATE domain-containing protein [Promicromonospora iranensis]